MKFCQLNVSDCAKMILYHSTSVTWIFLQRSEMVQIASDVSCLLYRCNMDSSKMFQIDTSLSIIVLFVDANYEAFYSL